MAAVNVLPQTNVMVDGCADPPSGVGGTESNSRKNSVQTEMPAISAEKNGFDAPAVTKVAIAVAAPLLATNTACEPKPVLAPTAAADADGVESKGDAATSSPVPPEIESAVVEAKGGEGLAATHTAASSAPLETKNSVEPPEHATPARRAVTQVRTRCHA
jgi:hypothetical protein